jgi:two-component system, OmpR family, response regulator
MTTMNASTTHSTHLSSKRSTQATESDLATVADLLARVEALLQRPIDVRETILSVGPLRLDLLTRTATRGERTIRVLPREFILLEYMVRHRDQLVTRAELFREVWNYKFVPQSNLVDVHMGRLRCKLDGPGEPPMILSVRGQGFVLRPPL